MIVPILLATPAWATPIEKNVVFMDYAGSLGGTIHISSNGGSSFQNVYAGPYQFNVYEAVINGGGGVGKGNLIESMVVMFCDSASYNLQLSYPYVELSGADVLSGSPLNPYGRLFSQTTQANAIDTYERMSWALQYAFDHGATWYKAAQIYIWELWSDAVSGEPFNLASGNFQVLGSDLTTALLNSVEFLRTNADTSVIASLNVPVQTTDLANALYSDTLSGSEVPTYFKNSASSQEFLMMPTSPVPEPGTLLLLGSGLAGLGGIAYRRRKS